jgi:tripartite-type tricarboxylate transporter receptor subunit TctC
MQREVVAILGLADVREKLTAQGIEPAASSPDELRTRIGNEAARWARILKEGGIRAE